MEIGTNVNFNRFVNFSRVAAPLLIIASWILRIDALVGIGLIIGMLWLLALLVLHMESTNCSVPRCTGQVHVDAERISFWRIVMIYTCQDCGHVIREEIFSPNAEITFESS